jgi:hypothetical protein
MERVSIWLESTASDPADAVSRNDVVKNVSGTAKYVRTALDALIVEGYVAEVG